MYKLLIGLTALLIASCAAFFSVKGIATLFSGAFLEVVIMAGSLELGKIVATTYLHHYWKKAPVLLKTYLLAAIILLMSVTSMGTYGFLSAAYQTNAAALENITLKVDTAVQQKQTLSNQIEQLQERINTLNESRKQQEKNLSSVTSNATTKYKLVYQDLERSNTEISDTQRKIDSIQTQVSEKDQEINTLKSTTLQASDIGAFKFIAENFNQPLNTVVKWFILAIVLVFDPLAVALVLSFNTLLYKKETSTQVLPISQETVSVEDAPQELQVQSEGDVTVKKTRAVFNAR